jgi:phage tail P2-like protein
MDLKDISLLKLLPNNLAEDTIINAITEAVSVTLREMVNKVPDVAIISNLVQGKITNETLIDLLAWQYHVDFYDPKLPLDIKNKLVLKSTDWHSRKGTPSVVEEIVSTVFTLARVQDWYEYNSLPYRFRVATEEQLPDTEVRKKLIRAIKSVKNTRSYFEMLTQLIVFRDGMITSDELQINIKTKLVDHINITDKFDGFTMKAKTGFEDAFKGRLRYNGKVMADGKYVYGGMGEIEDVLSVYERYRYNDILSAGDETRAKAVMIMTDNIHAKEKFNIVLNMPMLDTICAKSEFKMKGNYFVTDSIKINDDIITKEKIVALNDGMKARDWLPASDGTLGAEDKIDMEDDFSIGKKITRKFNGEYKADGSIKFNSGVLIPL